MTNRSEAKLNMYRATLKHADENAATTAQVKAFENALNAYRTKVSSIISTTQMETQVISGVALDKAEQKQHLCQVTVDNGAALFAYASVAGNSILKKKAAVSYFDLLKTKDDLMGPRCQNIKNEALANLVALKDYGITQTTLDAFQAAIDSYTTVVPNPRNAVSERKAYKQMLATLFKETDKILKEQMDKLIPLFKTIDQQFVDAYKSNRIILDAGTTTTQVKINITSAATGKAIGDAAIELTGAALKKLSNLRGNAVFKPLPPGTYAISISKPGYENFETPKFEVKQGQAITQKIKLVPKA